MWEHSSVLKLLTTLASGYTAGVRIQLGYVQDFLTTSSICNLHFIKASEAGMVVLLPTASASLVTE